MKREQRQRQDAEFSAFVAGSGRQLLRLAELLTGDPERAKDIVQSALERAYLHWHRITGDDPTAYVRRIWFTANQRCDESRDSDGSWHTSFGCRDVRSDNLEHDKPSVYAQTSGNRDRSVVASFYLGPTPSRIVAFFDGKPTVATIVTTAGMKGWTGYYVVLPPMPTGDPSAHRRPAGPAIGVYDAEGKLLAEDPGTASDGSDERAPQRL